MLINQKEVEQCINYRRWLHQHPEPSYQEFETHNFISEQLKDIEGLEIDNSLKPSLLATLKLSDKGAIVAFRADIDALQLTEETPLEFKSQNPGIMHACMHDMHCATLLSFVRFVGKNRAQFSHIQAIKFIFQSAEENPEFGGGAIKIAQSGFLDDVDYLFANHFDPSSPIGSIASSLEPMTANTDVFTIKLDGVGAHASRPHQAKDVIVAGAELILSLQTIISRELNPFNPAVLSICDVHAGEGAHNILPNSLVMRGTLRTMNQLDRDMCHQAITRKVSAIGQSFQLQASYDNTLGYPSVKCHPECLNLLTQALPDNVQFVDGRLGMAGEDVAYLINATKDKRGLLFLTGVADKAKPGSCYPLHNPALEGNEDALVIVLQTWINLIIACGKIGR